MTGHWAERAMCRTTGHPSDWDDELDLDEGEPAETKAEQKVRHDRAKAVCATCPVRDKCSGEVRLWEDSGIWFGVHLEAWRERQRKGKTAEAARWTA